MERINPLCNITPQQCVPKGLIVVFGYDVPMRHRLNPR
jgi:hypothetical protein